MNSNRPPAPSAAGTTNTAEASAVWAVLGQLNEVATALDEHQTPAIEQRLYSIMAHLAGTAATMAWDSGLQRRAQDYYRLALRSAHAGQDTVFGANVLAGMARQMLYRDRPDDALNLVRLAQDGSRGIAGPRVCAMLHTREAWAYAAQGRDAAFRRATAQAKEALAEAEPGDTEPYWIAYFDEAELAGVTGGRFLDLARQNPGAHADAAATQIRSALDRRGSEAGRSHALDWIGLAECHFLVGLSCIARGSDSLFAEELLAAGGRLVVVLPSRDYRQAKVKPDHAPVFDRLVGCADEVLVMPYEMANREAYEAANMTLLERADRVVAVWNGEPLSGKGGGTADVVLAAREAGLPVDVVWPEGAARQA
jgi:hypothetical protein